ncbi:MAG TPA: beta-ketoacyl-ACP synthase III [Candidatus Krumholzibacteria bacterium]|nr:beta-ketoacyl-ACP synthase III [Candidatus Krumholzibacteria bacterium]HPD72083.1 beta-ketoacyl-ACP synthase III [Candidatus Krumholzibacteria bacterium]HRY40985.1 beta-ketoacyl-ACP synthase III [Candidatus Krumholzibacteria bacterium]
MTARTLYAAGITGTGMSFPDKVLTNRALEQMVETNDDWIVERTGIKERRICEPGVPASVHGIAAARQALAMAKADPAEIDLIVVPTVTPDMMFPSTCCIIQNALGCKNAWGYDLVAACSSFIFALQTVRAQIEAGAVRKALVIGTEVMSSITDYTDRNTCILFGDGAGAVVVERLPAGRQGILDHLHFIDGTGGQFLYMPAGGSLHPASAETVARRMHYIKQEGREVYKFAVKGMASATEQILARNQLTGRDVKLFVPHQANLRIIEGVARRVGLADEQVAVTIDRFGNTTSATIPSALHIYRERGVLQPGDVVVLCAFGAGFTWGATLLRWTVGA